MAITLKNYGLTLEGTINADVKAVVDRSRGVSQRLNAGVAFLMKKNKIDVIWGEAKLAGKGKVSVTASTKKPMQPQPAGSQGREGRGRLFGQDTSSLPPVHARARCPESSRTAS